MRFLVYCTARKADAAESSRVASQSSITGPSHLGITNGQPDGQRVPLFLLKARIVDSIAFVFMIIFFRGLLTTKLEILT